MQAKTQENLVEVRPSETTTRSKIRYWIPKILLALALAICVTMCVVYKHKLLRAIKKFLVWSKAHSVAGPFLMALIISLTVITLLPYSIVAVSAGWAFN